MQIVSYKSFRVRAPEELSVARARGENKYYTETAENKKHLVYSDLTLTKEARLIIHGTTSNQK